MSTKVGPVQASILDRAGTSPAGNVMPGSYRERRSLRRMEARGIVAKVPGLPDAWRNRP